MSKQTLSNTFCDFGPISASRCVIIQLTFCFSMLKVCYHSVPFPSIYGIKSGKQIIIIFKSLS